MLWDETRTHLMRSLGNNDLRRVHVIEATWFVFSLNASLSTLIVSDDANGNANNTYGKLMEVLLFAVGAIRKIEITKSIEG